MAQTMLDPVNAVSVYRGESKTFLLLLEQPDPNDPNSCIPLPLENVTIYFTVKEKINDTSVVFQKVSTDNTQIEVTDPNSGIARIFIRPADTENMSTKCSYVFDVWVVLSNGNQHPVIKPSAFKVLPGVTYITP